MKATKRLRLVVVATLLAGMLSVPAVALAAEGNARLSDEQAREIALAMLRVRDIQDEVVETGLRQVSESTEPLEESGYVRDGTEATLFDPFSGEFTTDWNGPLEVGDGTSEGRFKVRHEATTPLTVDTDGPDATVEEGATIRYSYDYTTAPEETGRPVDKLLGTASGSALPADAVVEVGGTTYEGRVSSSFDYEIDHDAGTCGLSTQPACPPEITNPFLELVRHEEQNSYRMRGTLRGDDGDVYTVQFTLTYDNERRFVFQNGRFGEANFSTLTGYELRINGKTYDAQLTSEDI